MASGWACLPGDLLDSVLDRILDFPDFIRFCSVCQSWRSVAIDSRTQSDGLRRQHQQNLHLLKTCRNQLPILLMKPQHGQELNKRSLFSVTEGAFYDIQLPMPYSQRFLGSSRGWLFTIDHSSMVITLINPFLNRSFSLPPFKVDGEPPFYYIHKAKLVFDPDKINYEVLMTWNGSLARFMSKTQTWIAIKIPISNWFLDFISYRGQIYSMSIFGDLICVDFYRRNFTVVAAVPADKDHILSDCLVESQEGDLLLVRHFLMDRSNLTTCIEVYKVSYSRGEPRQGHLDLVRISSIGEQALFLGSESESISISTRDFPMCKPNCIYYVDGCFDISEIPQGTSFDKDRNTKEGCFGSLYPHFPFMPATWVVPYFKT